MATDARGIEPKGVLNPGGYYDDDQISLLVSYLLANSDLPPSGFFWTRW